MRKALLLLSLVALVVPLALPAMAADTATITGTVTNGTTKEPVPNVEVTLSQGNKETQQPGSQETTKTDRDGNFTFERVATGDQWQYDVGVTFDGELYLSDALEPKAGDTAKADLKVYETTTDPKDVKTRSWIVFLDEDPNGIAVEQQVVFNNKGDTTYVGEGAPDTRATTTLPVLPGAIQDSFQFLGVYLSPTAQYQVAGTTYSNTAALPPGNSSGSLRHVAPAPSGELLFPMQFDTDEFTLLAAPGITVRSTQLQGLGTQDIEGVSYTGYGALNLKAGDSVALSIDASAGDGKVDSSKAIGAVLLAVALLGALFLIVVRLRNPSTATVSKGPKKPPAKAPAKKNSRQPKPTRPERETSDEEDLDEELLVAEIAALDLSFEQGLMSEADHRRLREARKAQLLRLRRGEDA